MAKTVIPEFEFLGWPLADQLLENDEIVGFLIVYVPSHQGRAAIHRPECPLWSVESALMHNNTIFPFLYLVLLYLFK